MGSRISSPSLLPTTTTTTMSKQFRICTHTNGDAKTIPSHVTWVEHHVQQSNRESVILYVIHFKMNNNTPPTIFLLHFPSLSLFLRLWPKGLQQIRNSHHESWLKFSVRELEREKKFIFQIATQTAQPSHIQNVTQSCRRMRGGVAY